MTIQPRELGGRGPEPPEEYPRPDLHKLAEALRGPAGGRSVSITGLFVLASFYTLYFCRSLLLPLVLAMLFSLLLLPAVRGLKRLRIPEPLGAGLVLLTVLGGVGFGIYELSTPATAWMQRAPQSLRAGEAKLRDLKRSVQRLGRATEQVEKIAEVNPGSGPPQGAVAVQSTPTLRERLLSEAADLVTGGGVMLVLLYFLLASGDLFLRKLIKVLPRLADKRRAVEIARQVERDVSGYLSIVTMINLGLGAAVAICFALIGVPNPLLWGAMVTITNFVPYLGPAINYGVFAMVGLLTFNTVPHMLAPAGVFLVLNVLEAYLFTPILLAKRLTLNPVMLFVGLTFWGWLWGITGAVLAVPIMVVLKIFCDHIEPLAPIGEFLGE
ncbi:MAG TPA: AI-2E family transporter [Thermoanaerobaculia bacterium]|jgi:predicted PurR-regulated permease PerM|nr:AI-2E family transporter [Thermoanaerobaculia bacterium]